VLTDEDRITILELLIDAAAWIESTIKVNDSRDGKTTNIGNSRRRPALRLSSPAMTIFWFWIPGTAFRIVRPVEFLQV
jgi:hypothetical protein